MGETISKTAKTITSARMLGRQLTETILELVPYSKPWISLHRVSKSALNPPTNPMVNRVLTSPYLWWFDPYPTGLESAIGGLNQCWRDKYGHDRIIPRAPRRWKRGKRTLALFAGHRIAGALPAGQTIDNAVVRRAAASRA